MRGPLAVRLATPTQDRHINDLVTELKFTKTAPGGHTECGFNINAGIDSLDLGPMARAWVYDRRTGRTVWGAGYADNPGREYADAEGFDVNLQGGASLAEDQSRPLLYLDGLFDHWAPGTASTVAPSATTEASTNPTTGDDALVCQFNSGNAVGAGATADMVYDLRGLSGLEIGGFATTVQSGTADAGFRRRRMTSSGADFNAVPTTTPVPSAAFAGTNYPVGATWLRFRFERTGGATNIGTDNAWTAFSAVRVAGQILDRHGNRIVLGTAAYKVASQVAEDLLARMLPLCDPDTAQIDASTYQIDQLAYLDGARAATVLDDLVQFEPDYFWGIWESGPNGLHRFTYQPWPTIPRYELGREDGVSFPGGETDLCNQIAVYWTDAKGKTQSQIVTADVPELGGSPSMPGARIRAADSITLPDGLGSATNALQAGTQQLANKARPPKAGTATIARPVRDLYTGAFVQPWEIEPGYIARIPFTGDDLRITQVDVSQDDGGNVTADLTLGTPVRNFIELLSGKKVHRWAA